MTVAGLADTPPAHPVHKLKKQQMPPLPSGPRGPVPQIPLDSIPAVAPQVDYLNGQLTIVAPNSTLGDILRAVRKHTSAEIEVPTTANERVVTHLGPGPAREVVAELLNGSRFNYVLLGSPQDAALLTRVVLVAKPVEGGPANAQADGTPGVPAAAGAADNAPDGLDSDAAADDSPADDNADQGTAEAAQPPPTDQQGVKTPQQLLQEMQQRQLLMQQQQQQQGGQPGQFAGPGLPMPQRPQQQDPPLQ
jgi:hypothetical protein